jgi:hypothetical protein
LHGEIIGNTILVRNLYGEKGHTADVGIDGRVIRINFILEEISYWEDRYSRLLQNTDSYLPN